MKKVYLPLIVSLFCALVPMAIQAQDTARIAFAGMNPHVGQHLYFRVVDKSNFQEVGRTSVLITVPDFTLGVGGIQPGGSYYLDFWADLTRNGRYDFPGDHPWRIVLDNVTGDTTVAFSHNTNFTDIGWVYRLTVALSSMNPHLNENLYFRLRHKGSGWETERKTVHVTTPAFNVNFDGIIPDSSYMVDFFADHNKNGRYDPPAADHTWRITVDSIAGDTTVPFIHNTNFTDIGWQYRLMVNFADMTPHMNQLLKLYLRNNVTGAFIDSVSVDPITEPDFAVNLYTLQPDSSYNVDFWADLSGNRTYDAPPVDHAWRIELTDVRGDTSLTFTHNTDFTDIGLGSGVPTGVGNADGKGLSIYPNPARDELYIRSGMGSRTLSDIRVYNLTGKLVLDRSDLPGAGEVKIDVSTLKPGFYILSVQDGSATRKVKFVKQ